MNKSRSLRRSNLSFADEDEDADVGSVIVGQEGKRAENKLSLLSFDEPGDGVGIKDDSTRRMKGAGSKRSSVGLRIPPPTSAIPESRAATYTQISGAGEYSKERIAELQRTTHRMPMSKSAFPSEVPKVNGLFAAPPPSLTSMPLPPPPGPPPPASIAQEIVSAIEDEVSEEDDGPAGLSQRAIVDKARALREQFRSGAHAAPDYISMSTRGALNLDALRAPVEPAPGTISAGGARTNQDEEADDEGLPPLDEMLRMKFGPAGVAKRPEVPKVEEAEDEEEAAWAEEQIRKGLSSAALMRSSTESSLREPGQRKAPVRPPLSRDPYALPSLGSSAAAAAEEAMTGLRAAVQLLQRSQRQAEHNLTRTQQGLKECEARLEGIEEDLKRSGEKYVAMQEIKAYIADLCNMLAEKSPLVEELEEELLRAREERAVAHSRRCEDEEIERMQPASAAVQAAADAHSCGISDPTEAATVAEDLAEAHLESGDHIIVELDEFGRDSNAHRRAQAVQQRKRRVARRTECEALFDRSGCVGWIEPVLGEATTSESEEEVDSYTRREAEVRQMAAAAFADAADEFASLPAVKKRLEAFKSQYPMQYRESYMALSVPALFAPFVRRELLSSWTPLDSDPGSPYLGFDRHEWYLELFNYGMGESDADMNGSEQRGDEDADLIPRLVKALVLPLVHQLLVRVWNPQSTRQSVAVAAMLAELLVYVPSLDDRLLGIVATVQGGLKGAVEKARLPAWPPSALAASRRAQAELSRSFGRALRLLRSVCAFHDVLPPAWVRTLAVEKLMDQLIVPYVRAASGDPGLVAQRALRVLLVLPPEWRHGRGLEALVAVLRSAKSALERQGFLPELVGAANDLESAFKKLGDEGSARELQLMFGGA